MCAFRFFSFRPEFDYSIDDIHVRWNLKQCSSAQSARLLWFLLFLFTVFLTLMDKGPGYKWIILDILFGGIYILPFFWIIASWIRFRDVPFICSFDCLRWCFFATSQFSTSFAEFSLTTNSSRSRPAARRYVSRK